MTMAKSIKLTNQYKKIMQKRKIKELINLARNTALIGKDIAKYDEAV